MDSFIYYAISFAAALIASLALTPLIRFMAVRFGIVDRPQSRKVHKEPVPLWGGLAIYAALVVAVTGISILSAMTMTMLIKGIIVGGAFIVAVGMVDDAVGMPARLKLAFQIVGALILIGFGIRINLLSNPFGGGYVYLGYWGILITIFWVVAVTNAINLIDGLDGLASGLSCIASIAFFMLSLKFGHLSISIISMALAGACLGFLRYNFNPASIFMGDTGSMLLGYVLAAISVAGAFKGAAAIMLTLPVIVLGLPIFDVSFAILRRLLKGNPIFQADKGHLHHRLLNRGLSQRRAVMVLYIIGIVCSLLAVYLSNLH
ncbi:MAG: MraY family glycosyltransferase [bacterium]|jgi:UDP-GlcNAc:undecaprenyl-phosphate GlcNAc-1-phosphate transferase|nr:MraY family glycosyltransferase [bacterium]MDD3805129.1 MraY family glycosyltransferase [bacterium]MDD4152239.1 MraY family glycosyltransferase [bacterium]MDD4558251.1 MraY family glycosyltransferase [bacterium]